MLDNPEKIRFSNISFERITLMGTNLLKDFKDGQLVRVTGHLADADASVPNPVYIVEKIQPVTGSKSARFA